MQKPLKPLDEQTRLATLRSLDILDSLPEERFDRITRLAKRIFNVPIALISLIDDDRQWFLSSMGIDIKETSRDISFCGHAILKDQFFTVPDATLDSRFNDNPLVMGSPNIRFYAAYPISAPNGSKLGTICLLDQLPRDFSEEDIQLLNDLVQMVEQEISAIYSANLDDLTRISNKRGFIGTGIVLFEFCKKNHIPVSLLYIDLDNFKPINDQYGHAEGDEALKAFSNILRESFRDTDVIARIGGDEFAVLLGNCTLLDCQINLDRLNTTIETYNATANIKYEIKFSAGIAQYEPSKHLSLDDLLKDADFMMYKHKNSKQLSIS